MSEKCNIKRTFIDMYAHKQYLGVPIVKKSI